MFRCGGYCEQNSRWGAEVRWLWMLAQKKEGDSTAKPAVTLSLFTNLFVLRCERA